MNAMTFFVLAAAATAALALFNGIVSMAHGGEEDQLHSHELMFQRTAWQAVAVLFLLLALLAG
jgi:Hypoxia induced protein conserved region